MWHETAAHNVNQIAVVVVCRPDFAAYVIGGGQGWTAAFVLLDVVIITAGLGKMPNLDRGRQTCSPSHKIVAGNHSKNLPGERTATYIHTYIHT